MNQLSTTLNPRQPGTLPKSTIKIKRIMSIVWQSLLEGENILLIYLSFEVNIVVEKDDNKIKNIRESMNTI